ncbi:MAG: LuxR C-terminal-related transcriptional regulator, partial [Ktedonobacteraceae bacterium]
MYESTLLHDQLLTTKFFIPSASHTLIPRSRLDAQLNAGMKRKLTLISAPAGFGKTTLLSAWVQTLPLDNPIVAWVSLDEEDNDPMRFWEYALTALNTCQSELFTPLLSFFQTEQAHAVQSLVTAVINILVKQTEQFLLILDDYHVITESAVHTSLNFPLEHLPSQLHLILATRADPPLSLPRLQGRNQMLEVRSDQLQCTTEEVLAFFA